MSLKAKVEAIIYAAEEPVTLEQIATLLRETVLADLAAAKENAAIEQADAAAELAATNAQETATPSEVEAPVAEIASEGEAADSESAPPQSSEELCQPGAAVENVGGELAAGELAAEFAAASEEPIFAQPAAAEAAEAAAPESVSRKRRPQKSEAEIAEDKAVRARIREIVVELIEDYADESRGMEIRQVAGGVRMATKPEHHDVVRAFAKSLKPPIRLSLAALETLAVIAYKQPVTGPEISDIRGVESAGVLGTLLDRKLITTSGRKQVIGRPMQYKTSKEFLLRFGLNDVNELPSMEEFSQLASDGQIELTNNPETPTTQSLFEAAPVADDAAAKEESQAPSEASQTPADAAPAAEAQAQADTGEGAADDSREAADLSALPTVE